MRKNIQILISVLSLLLVACQENSMLDLSSMKTYHYTAVVSDLDTLQVDLLELSDITRVEGNPYWFAVEPKTLMKEGCSVTIVITKPQEEDARKDSVRIYGSDGDMAIVVVEQAGLYSTSDDENDVMSDSVYTRFITDWENHEFIEINGRQVATPWNYEMAETSLPVTVCSVKKNDGWEMAFCSITQDSRSNYFGIYNKYLGILRIFTYQEDYVNSGSEWIFKTFIADGSKSATFQSLYNSMLYGIPANHICVEEKLHYDTSYRLKGAAMLTQAVNPYGGSKGEVPRVAMGWTAFDIDMSHYRPGMYPDSEVDKIIYTHTDQLVILNQSNQYTANTLFGTLITKSQGKLDASLSMTTNNANGLNAWAANQKISKGGSDFIKSLMSGNYMGALTNGGSVLYNGAMLLSGKKTDTFETEGTFSGSLTMDTSGRIELEGFSISSNGNTRDLRVGLAQATEKTRSHLGKGVWGLITDPVIYVVNDYIVGPNKRFSLNVDQQDHTYSSIKNPETMALQLITCPDPSTIRVAISPVFKDVKNINVTWTWGVSADFAVGHSRIFREQVLELPLPTMVLDAQHKAGSVYGAYSGGNGNMYYKAISSYNEGEFYTLPDKKHHVWGKLLTKESVYGNDRFIQSPILYVPFTSDDKYLLYDPTLPDLMVGVVLTFDYKDDHGIYQRAVMSKRFLPKVEAITLEALKAKMNSDEVKRYMLPNAKVNGIGYPMASEVMKPSMYILDQL